MDDLKPSLEAALFASDEPLSVARLQDLLPGSGPDAIKAVIDELRADYERAGRAFSIDEIAGGYQMLTRPQYADILQRLRKSKSDRKLSAAAMETLAIIAYKQPIKRVDVEAIRGVQSGEIIRALMERGLVRIAGRDTIPGAPLLYATTPEFLNAFGISKVEDLPKPEEMK